MTAAPRTPTPIDQIAEAWVDTLAELDPSLATYIGRSEHNDRYADFSPEGQERLARPGESTLAALEAASPADVVDEVTKEDLTRELRLDLELHEAKWHLRDLNVIASPAQDIRSVFDLMPTSTVDDWSVVSTRLKALPERRRRLRRDPARRHRAGRRAGPPPGVRGRDADRPLHERLGVLRLVRRRRSAGRRPAAGIPRPRPRRRRQRRARRLRRAGDVPRRPSWPRPRASRMRWAASCTRCSPGASSGRRSTSTRPTNGASKSSSRMVAEQESIAHEIKPGASVEEAVAFLEQDPSRKLQRHRGAAAMDAADQRQGGRRARSHALRHPRADPHARVHDRADERRRDLLHRSDRRLLAAGPHVVVGAGRRRGVRHLARAHDGVPRGRSRPPPADRAGRVQPRRAELVASAARRRLGPRRRAGRSTPNVSWSSSAISTTRQTGSGCWTVSGCARPESCSTSACTCPSRDSTLRRVRAGDGGAWDFDYALEFMRHNVNMPDEFIRFEVNRYAGWPGQAPAYKVGQRIWEQLRDEVAEREGADFSIKAFHKRALAIGGVGLDTLRRALGRLTRGSGSRVADAACEQADDLVIGRLREIVVELADGPEVPLAVRADVLVDVGGVRHATTPAPPARRGRSVRRRGRAAPCMPRGRWIPSRSRRRR